MSLLASFKDNSTFWQGAVNNLQAQQVSYYLRLYYI